MTNRNILIFGASGTIGSAIIDRFVQRGDRVIAVSRKPLPETTCLNASLTASSIHWVTWDVTATHATLPRADFSAQVDAVIWAQGANCTDDIYHFDLQQHEALYTANVTYILISLHALLEHRLLAQGARLCIISSIWQNIAKQKKLSYCISKAALQGMVQSLAIDLGKEGYLVNAVLPGALDTSMTRANLNASQITQIEKMTPLGSLATLENVSSVVDYLCSQENTGITGQFIAADKGFSYAKII